MTRNNVIIEAFKFNNEFVARLARRRRVFASAISPSAFYLGNGGSGTKRVLIGQRSASMNIISSAFSIFDYILAWFARWRRIIACAGTPRTLVDEGLIIGTN